MLPNSRSQRRICFTIFQRPGPASCKKLALVENMVGRWRQGKALAPGALKETIDRSDLPLNLPFALPLCRIHKNRGHRCIGRT